MARALALLALLATGCATIFTGTSQTIHVASTPPGAYVVVLSSPTAPLILQLKSGSDEAQKVLGILSPFLSADQRAQLASLRFEALVTKLAVYAKLGQRAPELEGLELPDAVKGQIMDLLGVQGVGVAPYKVSLDKGDEYAVLVWQDGYEVHVTAIEPHFNWVTLVNVLNAFLGVPVDMITGAWFNIGPTHLDVTLTATAPAPAAAPHP